MKYVILISLIVLSSCTVFLEVPYYNFDCQEIVDSLEGKEGIDRLRIIANWVYDNIEYTSDYDVYGKDNWQNPEETYLLKKGDCEDESILFAYFAQRYCEGESILITASFDSICHMYVKHNNYFLFNFIDDYSVYTHIRNYTYEEVLIIAEYFK
jgi:hypothetical protein